MRNRMLAALLALPLLAFDCGGKEEPLGWNPFGPFGCTLHVGGAVPAEDLWCIAAAYDYSAFLDPQLASTQWVFEVSAYRGNMEIGAGGGVFLEGRPTVGATYWWNGATASSTLGSGGFNRYSSAPYELTHACSSLGSGSGEGTFSVTFSAIPPASAMDAELLGVHGTFTATLPPQVVGGGNATLSASF
jgi:hypothetical protein